MRRALTAIAVVAVLGLAGTATAAPADKHVYLEADDGTGCLQEGKNDCFRVTNDTTLDGFAQGDLVHVVLENVGDNPHNVYATETANADENNLDTAADDAINGTETVEPGETTDMMLEVPGEAQGLYFWCDVGTHEAMGMWLEADVAEAEDPGEDDPGHDHDDHEHGDGDAEEGGGEDGSGDDVGRFLPAPGSLATLVAGLGAVLAARARR